MMISYYGANWIGLPRAGPSLCECFGISHEALEDDHNGRPILAEYDTYLHMSLLLPEGKNPVRLDCFVSQHWVVTVCEQRVDYLGSFLDSFKDRVKIAAFGGLALASTIFEDFVTRCLDIIEDIEGDIDDLDACLFKDDAKADEAVKELVGLRHDIARLRRLMVRHRDIFSHLSHPGFPTFGDADSAEHFHIINGRLERAIQSSESARDMLIGSFEILSANTAQKTNDIMRVLTVVSVGLLPSTVLAGVLGMNFQPEIFKHAWGFWVAGAIMLSFIAGTITWARMRKWI